MKSGIWRDLCTHMFIAALFAIAKTWESPKCALADEWIEKNISIGILFIHIKWGTPAICDNIKEL